MVRAPVCGTGGRWFEATQLYHPFSIAEFVARMERSAIRVRTRAGWSASRVRSAHPGYGAALNSGTAAGHRRRQRDSLANAPGRQEPGGEGGKDGTRSIEALAGRTGSRRRQRPAAPAHVSHRRRRHGDHRLCGERSRRGRAAAGRAMDEDPDQRRLRALRERRRASRPRSCARRRRPTPASVSARSARRCTCSTAPSRRTVCTSCVCTRACPTSIPTSTSS